MTTLISFLGKGNKVADGYRTATYKFQDGYEDTSKYFGLSLTNKIQPTKIIILGTSGSMWDVFLEDYTHESNEDNWLALSDAVTNNAVTRDMLEEFDTFLSEKLGAKTECRLIDYAQDDTSQIAILQKLDSLLTDDEEIVMDVTHGFRHLPMIAMVAARFLQKTKNITVNQIYYGALEMTQDDKTPVLELKGLLTMLDWLDALTQYDKDNDYSVFADLLTAQGFDMEISQEMKKAAFLERNMNAKDASSKLKKIVPEIDKLENPIVNLFKGSLLKRLDWFEKKGLGLKQQALANNYLAKNDYLRAVIYAMEGVISRSVELDGGKVDDYDERKKFSENISKDNDLFRFFKSFRNSLAHGTPPKNKEVQNVLKDQQKLEKSLKEKLKKIFYS